MDDVVDRRRTRNLGRLHRRRAALQQAGDRAPSRAARTRRAGSSAFPASRARRASPRPGSLPGRTISRVAAGWIAARRRGRPLRRRRRRHALRRRVARGPAAATGGVQVVEPRRRRHSRRGSNRPRPQPLDDDACSCRSSKPRSSRPRTPELLALDALTPHVREISYMDSVNQRVALSHLPKRSRPQGCRRRHAGRELPQRSHRAHQGRRLHLPGRPPHHPSRARIRLLLRRRPRRGLRLSDAAAAFPIVGST